MSNVPNYNWPEIVQLLNKQSVKSPLYGDVLDFFKSFDCQRVLVACSGGADSVYMFCRLWAQAEDLNVKLIVAHYNHRWRGSDSQIDARFVEEMSRQLKCSFVTAARPEDVSAFTETSARKLRLDFLRATAEEYNCQCIAFGHQQDDILETQLQRLARGSGTAGLAAPRPVHLFTAGPAHVRPILHVRADLIREELKKCMIPWCEDLSNENVAIPRNALRNQIIPDLSGMLCRDVVGGAARSRKLLEEDAVALDQLARDHFPEAFNSVESLNRFALRAAPRALTRRALIAWLNGHGLIQSLSATTLDQLVEVIYTEKQKHRLSAGASFIQLDKTTIQLETDDPMSCLTDSCSLRAGESLVLSTGAVLKTKIVPVNKMLRRILLNREVDEKYEAYLAIKSDEILQVRGWQPGDCFRPMGAPGRKKLKKWFIDRQIPIKERKQLPLVLLSSGSVAWVPGFPPADVLKIGAETKTALKLTYQIREPTFQH